MKLPILAIFFKFTTKSIFPINSDVTMYFKNRGTGGPRGGCAYGWQTDQRLGSVLFQSLRCWSESKANNTWTVLGITKTECLALINQQRPEIQLTTDRSQTPYVQMYRCGSIVQWAQFPISAYAYDDTGTQGGTKGMPEPFEHLKKKLLILRMPVLD